MYPCVEVSAAKLRDNTRILREQLGGRNVNMWAVTKGFCAIPEIAEAIADGGVEALADARISNIKKLKDIKVKKVLLRIPMHHEIDEVVEYTDYSLNSELETLRLLGSSAVRRNRVHNVIVMLDLGDLREGVLASDIEGFITEAIAIKGICIKGFGVNLTCYGGVIPDEGNLGKLVQISKEMQEKFNLDIEIISGGNSSSFYLIKDGRLPQGINNLRLGEVLLLGRESAYGNMVEGLNKNAFILKAQLVEIKEKPSVPTGKIGRDAFNNIPVYEDRGIIKRGIVAVGRQDIDPSAMKPVDKNIDIIGATSDHTILDLTKSDREYKVGDVIEFYMEYSCLLRSMTSEYVSKVVVK